MRSNNNNNNNNDCCGYDGKHQVNHARSGCLHQPIRLVKSRRRVPLDLVHLSNLKLSFLLILISFNINLIILVHYILRSMV